MTKVLKKIGKLLKWIVILLILAIVAAGVYLKFFFDANAYTPLIAKEVKRMTGRELVIKNVVINVFSSRPGIVLEGVTFSNAAWGDKKPMVSAEKILVQVDMFALLDRRIRITTASFDNIGVLLQVAKDGRTNWTFEPEEKVLVKAKEGGDVAESKEFDLDDINLIVDQLTAKKVNVTFKDESTGELVRMDVGIDEMLVSLTNKMVKFDLSASLNKDKILASGLVSGNREEITLSELSVKALGSDFSAKGSLKMADKIDVRLDALSKKVDLNVFMPPETTETESEKVLAGAAVTEDADDDAEKEKREKIFTTDPLPFNYLDQKVRADISYKIATLLVKEYEIKDISAGIKFKDGRLEVPLKGRAGNGSLDMDLVAALQSNKKDAKINVVLEMDVKDIESFVPAKYRVKGGQTKLDAALESKGASTQAIAENMNGNILLDVSEVTAAVEMKKLNKKQDFKVGCAVAHLEFDKGIADLTRKIAVETDQGNLVSDGKIDLGDEWMNVSLRAGSSKYKDAAALTDLLAGNIVIKGHFLNPRVTYSATELLKGTAGTLVKGTVLQTQAMEDENPCATARKSGKLKNTTDISKEEIKDAAKNLVKEAVSNPETLKEKGKSIEDSAKETGKAVEQNVKDLLGIKKKK